MNAARVCFEHSPESDGHTWAETGRKQHRVACGTGYRGHPPTAPF